MSSRIRSDPLPSRRSVLSASVALAAGYIGTAGWILAAGPVDPQHPVANGGTDPFPIPWLDTNGSHNQPAGPNLEPSPFPRAACATRTTGGPPRWR